MISLGNALRFAGRLARYAVGAFFLCAPAEIHASESGKAHPARPGRGFTYNHDQVADGPWSIHVLKVDRSNSNLTFQSTLARGSNFGLTTLSEQIKTLPSTLGTPVAAINGDYYTSDKPYVGDPKGLQISQGELVSAPSDWTCFWIDAGGQPRLTNVLSEFRVTWPSGSTTPFGLNEERANDAAVLFTPRIGASTRSKGGVDLVLERAAGGPWLPLAAGAVCPARVRAVREGGDAPLSTDTMVLSVGSQLASRLPKLEAGMTLTISTATSPDLTGVTTALGGGPALARGGKALKTNGAEVRHPRTAIGWSKTHLYLVEVDGRQPGLSVGMTMPELAGYMVKLGCEEAMNLDGGGSSTFWVYGQVMNSPSEGRERGMANALILLQKEKK